MHCNRMDGQGANFSASVRPTTAHHDIVLPQADNSPATLTQSAHPHALPKSEMPSPSSDVDFPHNRNRRSQAYFPNFLDLKKAITSSRSTEVFPWKRFAFEVIGSAELVHFELCAEEELAEEVPAGMMAM